MAARWTWLSLWVEGQGLYRLCVPSECRKAYLLAYLLATDVPSLSLCPFAAVCTRNFAVCCTPVNNSSPQAYVQAQPPCWVPNPNCGSPEAFRTDIANWLQRELEPIGGALIFLAVLLFLTIVGSCVVSKSGRKRMLERIQELADVSNLKGGHGGKKAAAAPYANFQG